ncbi:CREB-regulated transcription coactivator 1 isoform X2 [Octopus bimaculoides]|uniref:CREB-regulated transcription coactivator 1 isoform X2 n=1 Tax=Octopus bimaculoides TaxID=37653 RepID=UPI00071E59CE|nr:CREB-regulated transcription coactivator 1 isoform X2 [Octopus bimaculoides]|eukprot:XP_014786709.1 PREDICTED: CREB-regulated transcription coactivator 1-like isoform X2 [Octopus bimaculoides]
MANPRKFSEKIALHNQKQAEETAAFEAIMREVSGATRGAFQKHLHITQNLGAYRGGSLPNVNQIASNSGILQTALQNLKDIEQGRAGPRDRSRQGLVQQRGRAFPTRADCSPYGATYLSLPPDTSWRRLYPHLNGVSLPRTNSDSALHTSTMVQQVDNILTSNTPPTHKRVLQVAEENSVQDNMKYWDPKKLGQVRPKSCEVPNINIYPSQEQDSGVHIPISNHAGSLPDLSVLQFPSPLATPLDEEEQNFASSVTTGSNINLSPNMNMSPTQVSPPQQSVSARRNLQSSPSPLVLTNVNQMRLPLSPPVSCVNPNSGLTGVSGSASSQSSSRVLQCMYSQVPHRQQPHGGGQQPVAQQQQHQHQHHQQQVTAPHHVNTYSPPMHHRTPHSHHHHHHVQQSTHQQHSSSHMQSPHNTFSHQQPQHQQTVHAQQQQHHHPPQPVHHHIAPQVHVTPPPCDDSQVNRTKYRNSESSCQSPTSPLSQTSYSPVQSPGLPPNSTSLDNTACTEAFYIQQQKTNQLQHQLEHFNMLQDNQPSLNSCNSNSLTNLAGYSISPQTLEFTEEDMQRLTAVTSGSQEFNLSSFYSDLNPLCTQPQQQLMNTAVISPQHQQSPQQQQTSHQQQQTQQQHTQPQQQQPSSPNHPHQQLSPQNNSKIPHIIFTDRPAGDWKYLLQDENTNPGADDLSRQDFARELGNAITGFNDFDADYLPEEEALKIGLVPLDIDDVQMLTDPNLVTDAATEDSFKLDRQ